MADNPQLHIVASHGVVLPEYENKPVFLFNNILTTDYIKLRLQTLKQAND